MTLAAILVPLAAAALVPLVPARAQALPALGGVIATFLVALYLPGDPGVSVPWLPGAGITFSVDPSGAASVLVLAAALATVPAVLVALAQVAWRRGTFLALLLVMQAMLNGLFLSKDLVLTYVFWEATLIPSLMMLGGWGLERRHRAVGKYLVYAIAGSFLMLVSILALRPLSGAESYRLVDLLAAAPQLPQLTQTWLFLGFTAAFAVKLPLWPLHSWLIDFHDQNHPSGAADVAGTLYKVGGFGFFAWAIPLLPAGAEALRPLLLTLAAVTALYGALAATQQRDLKRLVAYASLSHMGLVGVGVFSLHPAGMAGAMALLAAQMFSTGGLFLLAGMLQRRRASFALERFGGLARSAPALAGVTLFVLFAAIGVPGLSNFPGEFMSLLGAAQVNVALAALATVSVIAAGAYGVNLYQRLFQGPQETAVADLDAFEVLVLVPVLAGVLWMGLAPAPQLERIAAQPRAEAVAGSTPTSGALAAELLPSAPVLPGDERSSRPSAAPPGGER